MSIYKECSSAARGLIAGGDTFTEIDVVNRAGDSGWSTANWKEAARHSAQILAAAYRAKKVARFGPVKAPGAEVEDYVRLGDGKLVYAGVDSWLNGKELETPNGNFRPITYEDDPIFQSGRRKGSSRNDFQPWGGQRGNGNGEAPTRPRRESAFGEGAAVDPGPLLRRIESLRIDNRRLERRVEELVEAMKEGAAPPPEKGTLLVELPITEDLLEQLAELLVPIIERRKEGTE